MLLASQGYYEDLRLVIILRRTKDDLAKAHAAEDVN